jgi:mRNA interferase RelE/StbE
MALYRIYIRHTVYKDFRAIPDSDRKKILKRIEALSVNPRPYDCKKLAGQDRYRIPQGDYRIVYTIHDKDLIVWIIKVGNRKDIYRVSEAKAEYAAGKKTGESLRNKTGKTKRLP